MALRTLWSRIDLPRKRESAGAFCDTTATRSCMTFSAIDRGTWTGCASPSRLREMVGTSSSVSSLRRTMVTRSTLMMSKVVSTTVRRSRSRSSSAESFWDTSRSIWSFTACRASPVLASTRSCPAGGPSRLVMPGGMPPLTTSCRTICPPGGPTSAAMAGRLITGAVGPGPTNRKITLPNVIESSSPSRPEVTRVPLMQVPFELPRSFTCTPSDPTVSSACRREMVGS